MQISFMRVVNATRGTTLATQATIAASPEARRVGLLNRTELRRGDGLLIPAANIHTFGMRFPIDVAFLGEGGGVLGVVTMHAGERAGYAGAVCVLELPAGVLAASGTCRGDRLRVIY